MSRSVPERHSPPPFTPWGTPLVVGLTTHGSARCALASSSACVELSPRDNLAAGKVVEAGDAEAIFDARQTDYTRQLMAAAFEGRAI